MRVSDVTKVQILVTNIRLARAFPMLSFQHTVDREDGLYLAVSGRVRAHPLKSKSGMKRIRVLAGGLT